MFEDFSPKTIRSAEANIYKHIIKDFNIKGQVNLGSNTDKIPEDLRGAVFYQAIFNSGIWDKCDLTDASGNGTIFRDNDFYKAVIHNVSMQYCSFSDDIFQNCSFKGSNFANSTFTHCALQNSKIYGCSFLGTEFHSGIIRNTSIESSNFELCRFSKMLLDSLDLRQLTLNYAFFNDVTMKKVCLPFIQIPYTFNGLQYVFNTCDDITISSHDKTKKEIEPAEYKEMLQDFVVFYNAHNQYFPLTNCYIVQNKMDLAVACNETGVKISASLHDFRSLYFYCIQAAQILKISREKRGLLYAEINKILSGEQMSGSEYHQFYLYFPMIKNLLFDTPHNNPVITLRIKTNIEPDDYPRLSILLDALEKATNECNISLDSKHIELRHNSPNVIDYFASGGYQDLITNAQSVYYMLRPIIADVASIITIGGVLGSIVKNSYVKKETAPKSSHKKNASPNMVKLRKELNTLYENNRECHEHSPLFQTSDKSVIVEKLVTVQEELKKSGIVITELEIQFLDGNNDLLDNFYQEYIN